MQYIAAFESARMAEEGRSIYSLQRAAPCKRIRTGLQGSGAALNVSLGEQRLQEMRDILENGFTWKRSKTQCRFHESFLNACIRFLYAEDSNAPDYAAILEKNGWGDLRQQCLCMTPRRFGKTVAVGMYVTALALVAPCEQAIFSTGRRASSKLLELVVTLLNQVPGAADRIVKSNQEMVWISHTSGRLSKISSYPSCAKTLRGVGGDVVYMEEAGTLNPISLSASWSDAESDSIVKNWTVYNFTAFLFFCQFFTFRIARFLYVSLSASHSLYGPCGVL